MSEQEQGANLGVTNVTQNGSTTSVTVGVPDAADAPQRPEHIPEKFWKDGKVDVDALAKSYVELERSRSRQPQQPQAPTIDTTTPQPGAGLNAAVEAANADIRTTGKLSDSTYEAFEKVGVSRAHVDAYVSGLQAKAELALLKANEFAGGADKLAQMTAWARNGGMTQAEAQAYNAAVTSGDLGAMKAAIENLRARYEADVGTSGQLAQVQPGAGGLPPAERFNSQAEMLAAMNDPRYATDPAYRDSVARKIAGGLKAGVNLGIHVIDSGNLTSM